jgi:SAM-dependent methyltransferase
MSVGATPGLAHRAARRVIPAHRRPALVGAVRGAIYRGVALTCPCCGGSFREFRAHRGRAGARCPRCGALERHRALFLWLERSTDLLSAELSVLHVAPEYELQRRLTRLPNLDYLSADLDSPLAMVRTDLTAMEFPDESFDVVLCNHVLEHVDDDKCALREIGRVLRPAGWAVLQVPVEHDREMTFEDPAITTPAGRLRAYGQEDHARAYGRDFPERVRSAGLDVDVVDPSDSLSSEEIRRFGLERRGRIEEIYIGRRPAA